MLTGLEEKILTFVTDYLREQDGRAPTLAEIAAGCGLKSVGTVHRYVSQIQDKGYLDRSRKGWRTLSAPNSLPFLGTIAAGQPLEAIEQAESIYLSSLFVQPDCFVLKTQGESMIDAGILDGDLVVVERTNTARNGQIIVALINGSDASLKELQNLGNGFVKLVPHNKNLESMTYPADQVMVQGILRHVIRTY